MSAPPFVEEVQRRLAELRGALERLDPSDVEARTTLKRAIATLVRELDAIAAALPALRQDAADLVERYKERARTAPPSPDQGLAPTVRRDHLGSSTFIEKGWHLIATGDYDRAIATLQKALELAPDDPQAETLLGWAHMLRGDYDEALLHFQRVLVREPDNVLVRVNLGYVCLKKRIFGEAIEHLARAIRLDRDRKATLYAHYYLGLVYLEREMYEDARGFFERAIALSPQFVEAYWELGRTYYLEGDRAAAAEAWRLGAEANRFSPWGERCRRAWERVQAGLAVEEAVETALDRPEPTA